MTETWLLSSNDPSVSDNSYSILIAPHGTTRLAAKLFRPHGSSEYVDDIQLILPVQAARARQTNPSRTKIFSDAATMDRTSCVQGLKVHRLPHRPGFHVSIAKHFDQGVARATEFLLRDEKAT
jgi:hypothetical protein